MEAAVTIHVTEVGRLPSHPTAFGIQGLFFLEWLYTVNKGLGYMIVFLTECVSYLLDAETL